MKPFFLVFILFLPQLCIAFNSTEDDLVFVDDGDELSSLTKSDSVEVQHEDYYREQRHKDQRHWENNLPSKKKFNKIGEGLNRNVSVGHVFKLKFVKHAFGQSIQRYEVHIKGNGKGFPSSYWLYWDEFTNTLLGVPSKKDIGKYTVIVKALGKNKKIIEKFNFIVTVVMQSNEYKLTRFKNEKKHCKDDQFQSTILLNVKFENLNGKVKVETLEKLAEFLDFNTNSLSMQPLMYGEKHQTAIQWLSGCDERFWKNQEELMYQSPEQIKILSKVLQLPVIPWQKKIDTSKSFERNRRDTGSGDSLNGQEYDGYDDDNENYDDDYDEDEDEDSNKETVTENNVNVHSPPHVSSSTRLNTEVESEHPHRHHHGEETIDLKQIEEIDEHDIVPILDHGAASGSNNNSSSTTTSTIATITSTTDHPSPFPPSTSSYSSSSIASPTDETTIYSTREDSTTESTVNFSISNVSISTTVGDITSTRPWKSLEISSSTADPTTTTVKLAPTTTSTTTTTTTMSNLPPVLLRRIQKIPILAGKSKIQIIANDTFRDDVDGYTRNLHLSLSPKFDWIELNNETQELYMIPLMKDISRHVFKLTATNSRGQSISEDFEVYVQQPSKRVQFEFHLYLDILHRHAFSSDVDWKFKVIENLFKLFQDNNYSHITFTDIHMENNHRAILSWTNDTLSNFSECPAERIEEILHVLVDKNGNPSLRLKNIFLPSINVTNILNRPSDHSQCSNEIIKYAKSDFTTETSVANYNPILRNQIDRLNCTLGQLFVFKVPEDTFFDKKDGSTRKLNLSLRNSDGSEISPDEWLQFDSKNQEFYGVPMKGDVKSKIYHLEARDKEGLAARDSLKVHVSIPSPKEYSVEFSMFLEIPFEDFAKSAKRKRLFIEKVCELFGDSDTSAVSLESITTGSTVVTWRNTTLPTRNCPNEEIDKLRKVVVKEDKTLTDRVDNIMGSGFFPVKQISLTPLGSCLGELTGIHRPDSVIPPFDDSRTVGATNDEYLITFVLPAIIILTMLILAGIIACIFYKRRRSGKMSVSEQDDERQSFRNKGIPVIFQDELDEKPDPGNKSPIILKEEKPPLPPPDYQKSEDGADVPMLPKENSEEPYQPPPPFATNRDNNRQNRPKPTPTYRKPPPYVPP
ncbi:dystroglycan isoform X3 [Leptopilina heterotoma]|uniref:dystroglycan isoform X3 n=1 Tax=Leptopilina heterotoma TaxID=63436 RepID=UPI001CA9455E|nr:dystroglycan isoform X3 [Leptopilina heterotoma]